MSMRCCPQTAELLQAISALTAEGGLSCSRGTALAQLCSWPTRARGPRGACVEYTLGLIFRAVLCAITPSPRTLSCLTATLLTFFSPSLPRSFEVVGHPRGAAGTDEKAKNPRPRKKLRKAG
jgi:hypothetical protein